MRIETTIQLIQQLSDTQLTQFRSFHILVDYLTMVELIHMSSNKHIIAAAHFRDFFPPAIQGFLPRAEDLPPNSPLLKLGTGPYMPLPFPTDQPPVMQPPFPSTIQQHPPSWPKLVNICRKLENLFKQVILIFQFRNINFTKI
jgi:hypothetical protein